MQRRRSTILLLSLLGVTSVLIIVSLFVLLGATSRVALSHRVPQGESLKYHIVMIGRRTDSPFSREIYQGAVDSASSLNAVVELIGPVNDADRTTFAEYMDYAIAARASGIISFVVDELSMLEPIRQAASKGIPVVTLENDAINSPRQSFVGVSSYELGRLLGNLVLDAAGESARVVVLLDNEVASSPENIMLSSMREAVQKNAGIRIIPMGISYRSEIVVDETIRRIILNDPEIDVIVSLSVEDTLRVTQAVIDLNRSDRVSIIAFRESEEILEFVRKGLIHAAVVIDAKQMGRRAMEAMVEFLEKKHANDYIITDMHVVTKQNLAGFLDD